jgi:predicted TIM-barrel fold metal-dependent hydrolase
MGKQFHNTLIARFDHEVYFVWGSTFPHVHANAGLDEIVSLLVCLMEWH